MKDATNVIDTMLCLQRVDGPPSANSATSLYHLNWQNTERSMQLDGQSINDQDEHALSTINRSIKFFGDAATKELEEHIELLQEAFINHLEILLQKHDIKIKEKLTISLSSENQMVIQCQEEEDALLGVLGTDKVLLEHLQVLRKAALVGRGLNYILAVQSDNNDKPLPQYRVCTKGTLSHFYLKN